MGIQFILLLVIFVPILGVALFIIWQFISGVREGITIVRLLNGSQSEVQAEIIRVKKYLPSRGYPVWRYDLIEYKFDGYFGSSCISEKLFFQGQEYKIGDRIAISYLKDNPAVSAAKEIVSYDTIIQRMSFSLIVFPIIALGIMHAKHII